MLFLSHSLREKRSLQMVQTSYLLKTCNLPLYFCPPSYVCTPWLLTQSPLTGVFVVGWHARWREWSAVT